MGYYIHGKQIIIKDNNKISKFGIEVYIIYPVCLEKMDKF